MQKSKHKKTHQKYPKQTYSSAQNSTSEQKNSQSDHGDNHADDKGATKGKTSSSAKKRFFSKPKKHAKEVSEAPIDTSYTPIFEIKTGVYKSRKIHNATKRINIQNVSDICNKAGFELSSIQAEQIANYLYLIQKWNQSMNLVGKKFWEDILAELVMDSLHLAKYLEENPRQSPDYIQSFSLEHKKGKYSFSSSHLLGENTGNLQVWDLGAGAGLPGIPLRMLWQQGQYTMVEIREKRCFFLNTVLTSLGLPRTQVFRGKAEEFMEESAKQNIFADLIVSRAFMPWEKMLPFVAPYLQKENTEKNTHKGSIIFLTLEELHAHKYNSEQFRWQTTQITPYKIRGKTKFFCEVCLVDH